MKKFLTTLMIVFVAFCSQAQDKIIRKSGQVIHCKILNSDSTTVYYQSTVNNRVINGSIERAKINKLEFGTNDMMNANRSKIMNPQSAITIGLLHGGGALIGADVEFLIGGTVGVQFGAGFRSYGGGLNFHFKPDIRSSMISIQYWHQGFGEYYVMSLIGPNVVFRAKKLLTATIGLGYVLDAGPLAIVNQGQTILTYAVGGYFPF